MADYLKIPEVARRLDISEKTARRYVKTGVLPSAFIGGAYRVTEHDLEEFLLRAEVVPEAPKTPAKTGDERLEERLAPRVARLEGLEMVELSERKRELAEKLASLKEAVEFRGGTKYEIRDFPAYLDVTDEMFALMTVLERKAGKQLA